MSQKHRSKRASVMKLIGERSSLHVIRDPEEKVFTFLPSEFGYDGKPITIGFDEVEQLVTFLKDKQGCCDVRILAAGSSPPMGPLVTERDGRLPETCPLRQRSSVRSG